MDAVGDGRYELIEHIGSGGHSVVWRARDLQAGLAVAVKLPRPDVPGADRAISREVEALQRLRHANVVRLLDHGWTRGQPFVVLELLKGPTLEAVLEVNGPWGDEATIVLGAKLADALRTAHSNGIVHGDVKPQNVMLVDGEPRLLDFGTARDLSETMPPLEVRTLEGTLAYLAPELLAGEPPTPESDIFALGVTLFRTRSGQLPLRSNTPLTEGVPPLRSQTPDISPQLESLIRTAMSPTPSARRLRVHSSGEDVEPIRTATATARIPVPLRPEVVNGALASTAFADPAGIRTHTRSGKVLSPNFVRALWLSGMLGVLGVLLFLAVPSGGQGERLDSASRSVESAGASGSPMTGVTQAPTPTTPLPEPERTPDTPSGVDSQEQEASTPEDNGGKPKREKPPKSKERRGRN
jgi:serine/threonine protein kinase